MRKRSDVLGDLIAQHGLTVGAEIGVGTGPTTNALLTRHPHLTWLAVDYWPENLPLHYGGVLSAAQQRERRAAYMRLVEKFRPRLCLSEKPSIKAAETVTDGSLDLVFIDADHSYEACKADIAAWRPKLRVGGWLTGHDYYPEAFPGVVKAVDEMVPDFKLEADYVWMAQV